jgi:hypothetical protein
MNGGSSYEVNPSTGVSLKGKPEKELSFQGKEKARIGGRIQRITTEIASNMRANLDPEIDSSTERDDNIYALKTFFDRTDNIKVVIISLFNILYFLNTHFNTY